jgi:hypothetical protein
LKKKKKKKRRKTKMTQLQFSTLTEHAEENNGLRFAKYSEILLSSELIKRK